MFPCEETLSSRFRSGLSVHAETVLGGPVGSGIPGGSRVGHGLSPHENYYNTWQIYRFLLKKKKLAGTVQ